MAENRVRYRLSISPEMHKRVVAVGDVMGMDHQQAAYVLLGLGLRSMEQLVGNWDRFMENPELVGQLVQAFGGRAEVDKLLGEATKRQK